MPKGSPYRFAFVVLPKFSAMSIAALVEPLRIANYCADHDLYSWCYLTVEGGDISSSSGMRITTEKLNPEEDNLDAIIVCGGWNAARYDNQQLIHGLRILARRGVTLGAAETGAYVLARAGLLSGYKATIPWYCQQSFEESYPDIHPQEQLFTIDRKRMTCAGGTSGIDMILHHIERQHSKALAQEVSSLLVHTAGSGTREQGQKILTPKQADVPRILQTAVKIMQDNIEEPIRIPELAIMVNLSQRKLERLFNKYFKCTAVAFYRVLRLQQARELLAQTDMSVLDICIACGFTSSSYFSKSYTTQFGISPREHRIDWPDSAASPSWPGTSRSTDQGHGKSGGGAH
jgi:transcriptional regulator GlxA family with amidase domain